MAIIFGMTLKDVNYLLWSNIANLHTLYGVDSYSVDPTKL